MKHGQKSSKKSWVIYTELDSIASSLTRHMRSRTIFLEVSATHPPRPELYSLLREDLASRACIALSGKHRWALTGTPIHNSIDELYLYMRFLGADWAATDFDMFKKNFGNIEDDTVQQRLATFVPDIILILRSKTQSTSFIQICGSLG